MDVCVYVYYTNEVPQTRDEKDKTPYVCVACVYVCMYVCVSVCGVLHE